MNEATYQRVAGILRGRIDSGIYPPGGHMPSLSQLQAEFGVSSTTSRKVYGLLLTEGIVEGRPGSGYYAAMQTPVMRLSSKRLSRAERDAGRGAFLSDAAAGGFEPAATVKVYRTATPRVAADHLPGVTEVIVRERTHRADGHPVQLSRSYIPASIARGTALEEVNTGPGGSYARFEELGYRLDHFTELVTARSALPDETQAFQLAPAQAVLEVTRLAHTVDQVVEVNVIVINPKVYVLEYQIPAD